VAVWARKESVDARLDVGDRPRAALRRQHLVPPQDGAEHGLNLEVGVLLADAVSGAGAERDVGERVAAGAVLREEAVGVEAQRVGVVAGVAVDAEHEGGGDAAGGHLAAVAQLGVVHHLPREDGHRREQPQRLLDDALHEVQRLQPLVRAQVRLGPHTLQLRERLLLDVRVHGQHLQREARQHRRRLLGGDHGAHLAEELRRVQGAPVGQHQVQERVALAQAHVIVGLVGRDPGAGAGHGRQGILPALDRPLRVVLDLGFGSVQDARLGREGGEQQVTHEPGVEHSVLDDVEGRVHVADEVEALGAGVVVGGPAQRCGADGLVAARPHEGEHVERAAAAELGQLLVQLLGALQEDVHVPLEDAEVEGRRDGLAVTPPFVPDQGDEPPAEEVLQHAVVVQRLVHVLRVAQDDLHVLGPGHGHHGRTTHPEANVLAVGFEQLAAPDEQGGGVAEEVHRVPDDGQREAEAREGGQALGDVLLALPSPRQKHAYKEHPQLHKDLRRGRHLAE